jgi:hypothetical protein
VASAAVRSTTIGVSHYLDAGDVVLVVEAERAIWGDRVFKGVLD